MISTIGVNMFTAKDIYLVSTGINKFNQGYKKEIVGLLKYAALTLHIL